MQAALATSYLSDLKFGTRSDISSWYPRTHLIRQLVPSVSWSTAETTPVAMPFYSPFSALPVQQEKRWITFGPTFTNSISESPLAISFDAARFQHPTHLGRFGQSTLYLSPRFLADPERVNELNTFLRSNLASHLEGEPIFLSLLLQRIVQQTSDDPLGEVVVTEAFGPALPYGKSIAVLRPVLRQMIANSSGACGSVSKYRQPLSPVCLTSHEGMRILPPFSPLHLWPEFKALSGSPAFSGTIVEAPNESIYRFYSSWRRVVLPLNRPTLYLSRLWRTDAQAILRLDQLFSGRRGIQSRPMLVLSVLHKPIELSSDGERPAVATGIDVFIACKHTIDRISAITGLTLFGDAHEGLILPITIKP